MAARSREGPTGAQLDANRQQLGSAAPPRYVRRVPMQCSVSSNAAIGHLACCCVGCAVSHVVFCVAFADLLKVDGDCTR